MSSDTKKTSVVSIGESDLNSHAHAHGNSQKNSVSIQNSDGISGELSVGLDKKNLRRKLKERSKDQKLKRVLTSGHAFESLKEFLKQYRGRFWGAYIALSDEMSLVEVANQFGDINWVFPRISSADSQVVAVMSMHKISAPISDFNFEKTSLGFMQPKINCPEIKSQEIAGLFVPGVAFDRKGRRVGRGKGFYDRFLSGYSGVKIGVQESDRIFESVPYEEHDVLMDYILTEKEFYKVVV